MILTFEGNQRLCDINAPAYHSHMFANIGASP